MSELSEALTELQEAQEESTGQKEYVFIKGMKYRAIIEEITHDEIVLSGGYAEAGGFRATIPMADLPRKPEQGTEIKVREKTLEVIRITERNQVSYEITAGSLMAEGA